MLYSLGNMPKYPLSMLDSNQRINYEPLIKPKRPQSRVCQIFTNTMGKVLIYLSNQKPKMLPIALIALFFLFAIAATLRVV